MLLLFFVDQDVKFACIFCCIPGKLEKITWVERWPEQVCSRLQGKWASLTNSGFESMKHIVPWIILPARNYFRLNSYFSHWFMLVTSMTEWTYRNFIKFWFVDLLFVRPVSFCILTQTWNAKKRKSDHQEIEAMSGFPSSCWNQI